MANKVLRFLLTSYAVVGLSIAFSLALILQILQWILLAPIFIAFPSFREIALGKTLRFLTNTVSFYLNPAWHMKVVRAPPKSADPGKTMVMCNHVSAADPYVIAAAVFPWEMKYVFKSSLYKVKRVRCRACEAKHRD
eukprot:GHVU01232800.1.p1 GENE.GHVU01232800.1~~GHVU01232800.1.p1  ORF type:complete len:137 (+),score=7.73 GHVU01232800.1:31-441(+)